MGTDSKLNCKHQKSYSKAPDVLNQPPSALQTASLRCVWALYNLRAKSSHQKFSLQFSHKCIAALEHKLNVPKAA